MKNKLFITFKNKRSITLLKNVVLIAFVMLQFNAFSQAKISGVIRDGFGIEIPYAALALISLPDSSISGTSANEFGQYLFSQVELGNYILKTSSLGYQEKIKTITINSTEDFFYDLELKQLNNTLDEFSVTAIKKSIKFENGNITLDVENSPLSKGSNVYDLLSKVPGVNISDKGITLQGKTGVVVMIDGRPQNVSSIQLTNLLKSMSGDLVKSIKVLKNPPVSYDASGTSGMINIISKDVTITGVSGSVFSSYSQGFYGQTSLGGTLNYKTKKLVLFSNFSGNNGQEREAENTDMNFNSDITRLNFNKDTENMNAGKSMYYKVGMEWAFSTKNTIEVKLEGDPGKQEMKGVSQNVVSGDNNLGFDYVNSNNTDLDNWNTNNININFRHKVDSVGSLFTITADYNSVIASPSNSTNNDFFEHSGNEVLSPSNLRSMGENNSDIYSSQAALFKVIDSTSSFETGIKTAYINTANSYILERESNSGIYSVDTDFSDDFEYSELTYAGYFNYAKSIKNLSMNLGARIENTRLSGGNLDETITLSRNYFNIFPNVSFDYSANDKHNFQLNLNRRINRPDFYDLAPFTLYTDQFYLMQGNPSLLPDYANKGELGYSFNDMFYTSLAYSYIERVIQPYTTQNNTTNVLLESTKNMKNGSTIEYTVYYQKEITNKWDFVANGSITHLTYKGDIGGVDFDQQGISYQGYLSNVLTLGENTKMEINGVYVGPNIVSVLKAKKRWMLSLAISQSFFNEKLDLTIGLDDIFYTFKFKSESNNDEQDWTFQRESNTRRLNFSLNYRFGKTTIEKEYRENSNEEESNRLKH